MSKEPYCKYNNIKIDISLLEKEEWEYLRKLAPLAVEDVEKYCKKNEIPLNEFWFDNRSMYDYFDEKSICMYVGIHKELTFFSKIKGELLTASLNGKKVFKDRYSAEICGFIHCLKIREIELYQNIKDK